MKILLSVDIDEFDYSNISCPKCHVNGARNIVRAGWEYDITMAEPLMQAECNLCHDIYKFPVRGKIKEETVIKRTLVLDRNMPVYTGE